MKLGNGKHIEVKKIGAFTMMECIEIIQQLIEKSDIGKVLAVANDFNENNPEKMEGLIQSLRHVFQKDNVSLLESLICRITDLEPDALRADGDDSIGVNDIVQIFIEFYQKNDLEKEFSQLGELVTGAVNEARGRANGKDTRPAPKPNSSTCSPAPTVGINMH